MEAEAAEERKGKEWEAVVGQAEVDAEMEVDVGEGAEVGEAREEEEIEGEGARAEEEAAANGNGDAIKRDEEVSVDWKAGKKRKHRQQQPQPRTPGSAGSRASWRGRGGFHHRPWHGAENLQHHKPYTFNKPGVYGGAIMLCSHVTKRESFQHNLFCLPGYAATFIKKIRAGMLLFVFEREERKLYGVFEATSDGALNILPNAFPSMWKFRPAQVRFRRVWFCKPLTEAEFSDAIKGLHPHMSFFGISCQQVLNLVHLFSPKRIRLQPYQKPKSRVIWDYKTSLAHTGLESSLHTHSNACPSRSSSMFCNSRISFPLSSFRYAKQNAKHAAYKCESPLHLRPKSVIFKAPDIKEKSLELNADYIPLELDDCKSDSDAILSDILGTVSFYSALLSSISYEDQDPKPFDGKCNEDDGYDSPVLNQRFISESETGQNSAIAHIMKERQSSMQGKECKRKVQFDEYSDLSSPRSCTMAKKVSFNFDGDGISVTTDKALQRPALAELEQNREAVTQERQEVRCSVQDIQSKGGDVSAKRS